MYTVTVHSFLLRIYKYCIHFVYISQKLFFLLLHFPATMFYDPCYPSLFLCGWDHYYLDTIATDQIRIDHDQDHELSLIDIRYDIIYNSL